MKKILFCFLFCFSYLFSFSQTSYNINTINGQTTTITSNIVLYDSGGPSGNYGNSENYTTTFCAGPGMFISNVVITYWYVESSSFDGLTITSSGTNIWTWSGTTSSSIPSPNNWDLCNASTSSCVTFAWHTDGSVVYGGFAVNVTVANQSILTISNINVTSITTSSANVSWTSGAPGPWIVEYGATNFTPGTGIQIVTTNTSATLTNLQYSTGITLYIYPSGNPSYSCNTATFTTPCGITINISNITTNSANITWTDSGSTGPWTIEYGPHNFIPGTSAGTTINTNSSSASLTNLSSAAQYDYYIYSSGSPIYNVDCNMGFFTTTCEGIVNFACFDFTNFNLPTCVCRYGTFTNPNQSIGVVNNGPTAETSRHTVHTDLNETDIRTNNLLHTVPMCSGASVRLGNWGTGAQAESITYEYTVNASENELLILKYAAVMEDPSHSMIEQPKFTIKFLNSSGMEINPSCYSATFVSGPGLGWNVAPNSVLWKDWTTVGVDLSNLDGQTIYIQLTTYDCSQSGHYGYAYFVLNCGGRKNLSAASCGESTTNTFYAPLGFNYRWYEFGSPNVTLSTSNELNVTGYGTYYCECSFLSNNNCSFLLSAVAGPRYPLANFTYEIIDSCSMTVHFINNSDVSSNGVTPNGTGEGCETAYWDFGDGTFSYDYSPTHTFGTGGTYDVYLSAGLANNQCTDTIHHSVALNYNNSVIDAAICQGQTYTANGFNVSSAGTYTGTGACGTTITLNLNINPIYNININGNICMGGIYNQYEFLASLPGTYTQHLVSQYGCDSVVTLYLNQFPSYYPKFYASICEGATYSNYGFSENTAGIYVKNLQSVNGCDSIITLYLTVHPSYNYSIDAAICEGTYYNENGFHANQTGTYVRHLATKFGCDSIVTLNLTVNPKYYFEYSASICGGEIYTEHGFNHHTTGTFTQHLQTTEGCDSILVLHLSAYPEYHSPVYKSTICDGDTFTQFGFNETKQGTYVQNLKTINGCDSIIILELKVMFPEVEITARPKIEDFCSTQSIKLSANTFQKTILWSTGETTKNITVTQSGYYIVSVSDGEICNVAVDSVLVRPCPDELDIPNAFTPNGDGTNDTWVIDKMEQFEEFTLEIFNTWGQKMFECKNIYIPWDGKYKNRPVPTGTYLYVMTLENGKKKTGTLTVVY
ncbi:MAG: gliding motility-associated C-terminal domain-containing protein [Bacteroidales bacterium]|jgi:gliding motility-associated-like protein|nr:gliding motility-associated C-terminal domain-containing protein [Bacteroidales bacterium]